MSEQFPTPPEKTVERKLWFDGPNFTADAVVIHPDTAQILLIQRRDTEQWALPGGFVDPEDATPLHAAAREAYEEASITLEAHAPRIFQGVVDDPRNSETAWIETSAYLFSVSSTPEVAGTDDAQAAQWHSLEALPPLYASHQSIVERALDYIEGAQLVSALAGEVSHTPIAAGHMEYVKTLHQQGDAAVFTKQHTPERFTDPERAERSLLYLEKEASIMAHLRQHAFTAIPNRSILHNTTLAMEAFRSDDGWQWRADPLTIDHYIHDTLEAFQTLEAVPLPADSFAIDPSIESFRAEGWQAFGDTMPQKLEERFEQFSPYLSETSRDVARELLGALPDLQQVATNPHKIERFVFCHHDIRQSNLAWHPEHGTKLVDWSWAGIGEPNSDSTTFLIDLAKSGYDISAYHEHINPHHCLTLIGFWLAHSTWPAHKDTTVRFQQFVSALSAYEVLRSFAE